MSNRVLIAYLTHSGNTRRLADGIHKEVDGTTFEIEPETAYPKAYNAVVEQAKKEIQAGYHPALKTDIEDMVRYDTILVGSPNWWGTVAPPVSTFLASHDWAGKTVVPFCTHGGGGQENVLRDISKQCPGATVLDGFEVYGRGSGNMQAQISAWLHKIGLIR